MIKPPQLHSAGGLWAGIDVDGDIYISVLEHLDHDDWIVVTREDFRALARFLDEGGDAQ